MAFQLDENPFFHTISKPPKDSYGFQDTVFRNPQTLPNLRLSVSVLSIAFSFGRIIQIEFLKFGAIIYSIEFRNANTANNLFFNILFRIKCDKIDAFIRMAIIVITQMI